jgi:Glyoxalase-like domain
MAARFSELAVDSSDPGRLSRWWSEVLDYKVIEETEDVVEIAGPTEAGPTIVFASVPEPKTVKNRLHIDLSPTDRDQDEELERLLGLGARRADVGQGDDVSWVVLTDPEGNEFCLLRTRREPWGG